MLDGSGLYEVLGQAQVIPACSMSSSPGSIMAPRSSPMQQASSDLHFGFPLVRICAQVSSNR
jgi:hypothetical protein